MKKIIMVLVVIFTIVGVILFKEFYTTNTNNSSIKYTIMVSGTSSATFPSTNNYTVSVNCTSGKGAVVWNPNLSTPAWQFKFENGYVNNNGTYTRTNITSNDSCTIDFTPRTSSNKLNTYIKSLLGGGTSVSAGESGNTLENLGTAAGKVVYNGTENYYHDIGIRYIGPNPNNYIKFNNELWRIIGIFREAKTSELSDNDTYYTKIIRNESIGGYAYNGVNSNGGWWSKSDGSVSTLNYMLNHYYMGADNDNYNGTNDTTNCKFFSGYNSTVTRNCDYRVIGIQPGWRDMVINTTWYTTGGVTGTASTTFSGERSGTNSTGIGGVLSYKDTTTNKYSKVGLMYPSDYLYSGSSASNRWLLQNGYEWTISPNANYGGSAWVVSSNGSLESSNQNSTDSNAKYGYAVRPTVYLSSDVYITGGTGTLLDPYTIAM